MGVLVNKFLWKLVGTNANTFWAINGSLKVQVGYICREKVCILLGADAVEDTFDQFKLTRLCARIAKVCNSVASDGCGSCWAPLWWVVPCRRPVSVPHPMFDWVEFCGT